MPMLFSMQRPSRSCGKIPLNPKILNDFETFPKKPKHGRSVHHNWKSQATFTEIFWAYFLFWNFIFPPWCFLSLKLLFEYGMQLMSENM